MSQAQFTIPLITVISGQLITASLWNNEWTNVGTNLNPPGVGGYSDTDTQMQIQTAPYPSSVTSHATNLGGELERIRYQLSAFLGATTPAFWYAKPPIDLTTVSNVITPLGAIIDYPSATPPSANFLLANGQAIGRTIYANLFGLIGTTFGTGDGSTTFNIPNLTDLMTIGAGNLYALAATGGATSQTPVDSGHTHADAHTHTMANHTHTGAAHTHSVPSLTLANNGEGNLTATINSANAIKISGNNLYSGNSGPASFSSVSASTGTGTSGSTTPGAGGVPNTNTTDSQSVSVTSSGVANIGTIPTLPPYMGLYKMMRVL